MPRSRRLARLAAAATLAVGAVAILPSLASAGPMQAQLSRTLPELKLDGVALGDALDFLRDVAGVNLVVEWKSLEAVGVTRETPVNVRLRGVSLRKALNTLLSEAGGGDQLGWMTDEGVITVTTKEKVNAVTYTRIYDVRDLLMEIPDFDNAPSFSLQDTSTRGGGGGRNGGGSGGGNSSGGLLGGSGGNSDRKEKNTKTKDERAEELVTMIRDTISPQVWVEGGGTATIRYFNGSIIVRAPKYVHEAIGGAWD